MPRRVHGESPLMLPLAIRVAAGSTVRDAARELGINDRHSRVLSSSAEFKARLEQVRAEVIRQASDKLTTAALKATDRLVEHLDSSDAKTSLKAAEVILANASKYHEMATLADKVAAIEQALANRGGPAPWNT